MVKWLDDESGDNSDELPWYVDFKAEGKYIKEFYRVTEAYVGDKGVLLITNKSDT